MPKVSDDDLARRRSEILDAARTCFYDYGYEGATVRRLEEATGRKRGAIFHHFGDKQGLFIALAREDALKMAEFTANHGIIEVLRTVRPGSQGHKWALTRIELLRLLRTDASFAARWAQEEHLIDDAIRSRIHAQVTQGTMRTDIDEDTIYALLDIVFEGVFALIGQGKSLDHLEGALDAVENSLRRA